MLTSSQCFSAVFLDMLWSSWLYCTLCLETTHSKLEFKFIHNSCGQKRKVETKVCLKSSDSCQSSKLFSLAFNWNLPLQTISKIWEGISRNSGSRKVHECVVCFCWQMTLNVGLSFNPRQAVFRKKMQVPIKTFWSLCAMSSVKLHGLMSVSCTLCDWGKSKSMDAIPNQSLIAWVPGSIATSHLAKPYFTPAIDVAKARISLSLQERQ